MLKVMLSCWVSLFELVGNRLVDVIGWSFSACWLVGLIPARDTSTVHMSELSVALDKTCLLNDNIMMLSVDPCVLQFSLQ